jgi:predicted N-acyltransferase
MENRFRPDSNESAPQRERYDTAQVEFCKNSNRIDRAANSFQYSRQDFHALEDEFLALIEELRRTSLNRAHNLAHLEGMRIRLLTSFDNAYKEAVNELVDAMVASISQEPGRRDLQVPES